LHRNPRQCRERWKHYLSGSTTRVPWTPEEDRLLFDRVCELGPCWTKIAGLLGTRTDIEVKTRWFLMYNEECPLVPKIGRPTLRPRPHCPQREDTASPPSSPGHRGPSGRQSRLESIALPSEVEDWFCQAVDLSKL
jgi:hypothetical protein